VEKPDKDEFEQTKWITVDISVPGESVFVTAKVQSQFTGLTGRGQSRCAERAMAYALKDLALQMINNSVAVRGWE
jgi:hypothetical protein